MFLTAGNRPTNMPHGLAADHEDRGQIFGAQFRRANVVIATLFQIDSKHLSVEKGITRNFGMTSFE